MTLAKRLVIWLIASALVGPVSLADLFRGDDADVLVPAVWERLHATAVTCPSRLIRGDEIDLHFCGQLETDFRESLPDVKLAVDDVVFHQARARLPSGATEWTSSRRESERTYFLTRGTLKVRLRPRSRLVILVYPRSCLDFEMMPAAGPGEILVEPEILERIPVKYPEKAIPEREGGAVVLDFLVGVDGTVTSTCVASVSRKGYVSRKNVGFADAAVEAVRQWRYRPAHIGDTPVTAPVRVQIRFTVYVDAKE